MKISCVATDFEEVVEGLLDSTKTFHIKAFDGENPIESVFDKYNIKLSKSYGLVNWIPFHGFFGQFSISIQLAGFEDTEGNTQGERPPLASYFFPHEIKAGDFMKWEYTEGYTNIKEIWEEEIIKVTKTDTSILYLVNRTTHRFVPEEPETISTEDSLVRGLYIPQQHIDYAYWNLAVISRHYSENNLEANLDQFSLIKTQTDLEECFTGYELIHRRTSTLIYSYLNENEEIDCERISLGPPCTCTPTTKYQTGLGLIYNVHYDPVGIGIPTDFSLIEASLGDCYFTNIQEESYFASQITLHPNPTQNRFFLQLKNLNPSLQSQNLQLKITDIHGRILQQSPILQSNIEVDLSDYANGIYLVQVSDGVNWWTEKVVKY